MACTCKRCGTTFKKKEYLLKHLKKTIVCPPKLEDIPRDHLLLQGVTMEVGPSEMRPEEVNSQDALIEHANSPAKDYDKMLESILNKGYKIIHIFNKCVNFVEDYEEELDGYLLTMRQVNHKHGEDPMLVYAACLGERMIFFEGPNENVATSQSISV